MPEGTNPSDPLPADTRSLVRQLDREYRARQADVQDLRSEGARLAWMKHRGKRELIDDLIRRLGGA